MWGILLLFFRIQQLESAVDKMKSEQERLMRKLKDESERKSKLEVGHLLLFFRLDTNWFQSVTFVRGFIT